MFMTGISGIIPISIIAVIVFVVAIIMSAKNEHNEGGEDVIKNVYVYLVLFATLMMVIGGSVAAFMAAADIITPTPYYQSFDDYKRMEIDRKAYSETEIDIEIPSEEELRERYDNMLKREEERQLARAKNTLIKSFGWIIIPLPIFIFFQKKLAKNSV